MTRSKPILFLSAAVLTTSAALVAIVSTGAVIVAGGTTPIPADALACDMAQYKSRSGLTAAMDQNVLTVAWNGQNGSEMRTRYAVDGGQPVVRDLAVRKAGGAWVTLGQNLTPEYHVVSGIRRMSTQQADLARDGPDESKIFGSPKSEPDCSEETIDGCVAGSCLSLRPPTRICYPSVTPGQQT